MDEAENTSLLDDFKSIFQSAADAYKADQANDAAKRNAQAAAINAQAVESNTKKYLLFGGIAAAVIVVIVLVFRRR